MDDENSHNQEKEIKVIEISAFELLMKGIEFETGSEVHVIVDTGGFTFSY